MKKIIFTAVFLLSVSTTFAQLDFGIKAGYNSSFGLNNLSSVTTGDYTLKSLKSELDNGFHAGLFARVGFKKMYFQPELLYTMGKKNYTVSLQDVANNAVTFDKFVTVSAVDVPLLVGYKVLDLKLTNIRVFAGPKLRFNAGSSLEFKNFSTAGTVTQDQLVKDIKTAQVGFEGGFGVDILKFTLDARYNLIGDMYQTKLNSLSIDKMAANNFVISLGWKLF